MAQFRELAVLAGQLAGEASRLNKRAAIAAALARIVTSPDRTEPVLSGPALADAGLFCLYLAGQPFPEADPRKLNAGGALLTRAVREVSGCTEAALTAAYRRHGDLGAAAHDLLAPPSGQAPAESTLTLNEIAVAFHAMATARATAARAALVEGLLRKATAIEAMYLLKLMLGDMRIGVKQSLIEEAIAVAAVAAGAAGVDVAAVRHAVMLEADLAHATMMAFTGTLAAARMRLFHPLGFMLASPVETPEEAAERFLGAAKPAKPERPKPEKVAKPAQGKPRRKRTGGPDDPQAVVAQDAAELGYAEDIEASASAVSAERHEDAGGPAPLHVFLEDKYDGMRAQLHFQPQVEQPQPGATGPRVALYSRNREDVTHSFPEIVEAFHSAAAALPPPPVDAGSPASSPDLIREVILDGELLGWDFAEGRALPFSILGQRIGRKRVDNAMRQQVPVVFMAFDLLFSNGELLLPLPLRERRTRLEELVGRLQPFATAPLQLASASSSPQGGLFAAATAPAEPSLPRLRLSVATLVESAGAIDRAYYDARARANEGVMLKAADSAYLPGRRGLAWMKLKRELATLDVVITGAEFGSGRRARLLSDYTFAVRGPAGELLNVGKAYSGVTDVEILELTEWLQLHTLEDRGHFRTVEPIRVLEVAFNNVMRSDRHASGFALRFPRILRIRDDKPVEEIDTLERVEEIYQSQPDKGGE